VSDRPRLGVSACLLGEPVRYNAGHKRDDWLVDVLGPLVEWVAVCPEVEAGFGTPRETMQLVWKRGEGVALLTTETGRDVTTTMRRFAERRIEELAGANLNGYVFKADSPSCGVAGVPLIASSPDPIPARCAAGDVSTASGLFAAALMSRLPDLPIADERRLADPDARQRFVERVFAHHHARKIDPS
jgi:uncharacterized protein YbbK (DUF523 family)